jgi:signal peptidase I
MAEFDLADVLPEGPSKEKARRPVLRAVRIALWIAAGLLGLFLIVATSFFGGLIPGFQAFRITTDSTAPALVTGDRILADMRHYQEHAPVRGDLVVFLLSPPNGSVMFVKRVSGLPGDLISGTAESITLNGQILQEAYVSSEDSEVMYDAKATFGPLKVPEGHVFPLGDHRQHSYDSRHFGPMPIDHLKGKDLYISWSKELSRIGKRVE